MSDERRTPENLTEADDRALGEALGTAIGERVDAPITRPSVSHIADRAAAQAKARHTRQAVVGIAASLALVAGGIAAWNALENDQPTEVIVVDDPTVAPVPAPTAQPTAVPTAPSVEEPRQTVQEEAPGPPQTSAEVTYEPITPESVSTGPALAWTQFDAATVFGADAADAEHVVSVGDGRVLVRGDGNQVLITDNGTDWTVISMPPDFAPERFDIAGGRWLVTGWDASTIDNDIRAVFSDDQGATWTELALDLGSATQTTSVADALVSGNNMVIATESRIHTDIASVIVDRGLVPDKEAIKGWMSVEGDTVSFTRDESSSPESFELTAEEEDSLFGGDRNFVRLFHSDGRDVELVAEYPAQDVAGYGADDGFHLLMLGTQEHMLLTSPDGRQWSEALLTTGDGVPVGRFHPYYGTTEATVWISGQSSSEYRVEPFDGVYTPALVADLPNGIARVDRLSVGPAGIAMVAEQGNVPDTEITSAFQVTKDGYELRIDEPNGGFTLWDLAEDTAVYVLNAENGQNNMFPEGFRVVEDGEGAVELLIFEDPETGEHLVSFTSEELEPWASDESLLAEPDTTPQRLEAWMGWSADGTTWDWKTLSEAFGLTGLTDLEKGFTNVELAVGADFVIARVQPNSADPSDTPGDDSIMLSGRTPLWFIATVR